MINEEKISTSKFKNFSLYSFIGITSSFWSIKSRIFPNTLTALLLFNNSCKIKLKYMNKVEKNIN